MELSIGTAAELDAAAPQWIACTDDTFVLQFRCPALAHSAVTLLPSPSGTADASRSPDVRILGAPDGGTTLTDVTVRITAGTIELSGLRLSGPTAGIALGGTDEVTLRDVDIDGAYLLHEPVVAVTTRRSGARVSLSRVSLTACASPVAGIVVGGGFGVPAPALRIDGLRLAADAPVGVSGTVSSLTVTGDAVTLTAPSARPYALDGA